MYHYSADDLGTAHDLAEVPSGQSNASLCYDSDFYPFGGERTPIANSCTTAQHYKFTGKERDSESNLDNFGARYYSSGSSLTGRFLSPDWSSTAEPVPYAKLGNPQTLNLYGYAADRPTSFADADGHCFAPSVAGGHVAICLESYIQAAGVGAFGQGLGDNRGPVANDPKATFRTQTMIDVSLGAGRVTETSRAGVSRTRDFGSRPGLVHDWISGVKKGSDGSVTFTVHVYGENGFEAAGGLLGAAAPGGWIEMVFTLRVAPDGKVSVIKGSDKKFPSVSIYSYQSSGAVASVYQQKESGHVKDLEGPRTPVEIKGDAQRQCADGNPAACL